MNTTLPALFVSHGAPSMIIENCPAREFLIQAGRELVRPTAIVAVSAHWTTREPRVTTHPHPGTMYDFGGFADELYKLRYPAPGDPLLARRVLGLLRDNGIAGEEDASRGFDHGAWAPLMLMYPAADIPVIQLSVQPHMDAAHHAAVGRALRPLRDDGILIVASGSTTHNLGDFFGRSLDAEPLPYAREFSEWLKESICANRTEDLLDFANRAPNALRCHPTPEHLLPLFVAMGVGNSGSLLHDSYTYGAIGMAAFAWH